MGRFSRDPGEFVESNDKNYNIKDERGEDGEVKVEGQDRYLWPSRLGDWNDKGEFPNEEAAKDFIDEDSHKEPEEAKDESEAKDSSSEEKGEDSSDSDGGSDREKGDGDESDKKDD